MLDQEMVWRPIANREGRADCGIAGAAVLKMPAGFLIPPPAQTQ